MKPIDSNIDPQAKQLLLRFYSEMERKIDALSKTVVMVAQTVPGARIEGFGTGFFYEKDGWTFFITAKHVLDDAIGYLQQGRKLALITRGCKAYISFDKLEFFTDDEFDIAVTPLWKSAKNYSHVEFLKSSDIVLHVEQRDLNFYVFTGFPASRNKTYAGRQIKAQQLNITLFVSDTAPKLNDISAFNFFDFDPRKVYNPELDRISMGYPEGMSGGPIFKMIGSIDNLIPRLAGIGLSCISGTNHLKSMRFDLLDTWLENYFNW